MELSSFSCARSKRAWRPVPGAKRCASFRNTKSSRVGGVSLLAAHLRMSVCLVFQRFYQAYRSLNRCHRTLTGASTLTRRKKGRRSSASTTFSSHMSVVTHRSLHLKVTKSSKESTVEKEYCASTGLGSADGTWAFEADFSTAGVAAVRARRILLN